MFKSDFSSFLFCSIGSPGFNAGTVWKKYRIFDRIFGIWDFFRWDFWRFLEEFWADFWRTFGGVLDGFSYSFGGLLGGF